MLNNLVRCCNAFANTSTSPTSLDSRCSAIGPEPEAPDNGQAIDAGIIQTNVPSASPRLGMLRNPYRLLAPSSAYTIYYHRTRARVINYWHPRAANVLPVYLPTTSSERTRKIGPEQPEDAMWFPLIL
jgi:hypothetical protein